MSGDDQILPVPVDDGAAGHLVGRTLPCVEFVDARGTPVDLSIIRRAVVIVYPATGVPGRDPSVDPAPGWDAIPGASGCTAQSLGFRDAFERFLAHGFKVIAISSQPHEEQTDFVLRHAIPFTVLSDPSFQLADALALPTFTAGGNRFYRRLTMIIANASIAHVIYPVFPSGTSARDTLAWIQAHPE